MYQQIQMIINNKQKIRFNDPLALAKQYTNQQSSSNSNTYSTSGGSQIQSPFISSSKQILGQSYLKTQSAQKPNPNIGQQLFEQRKPRKSSTLLSMADYYSQKYCQEIMENNLNFEEPININKLSFTGRDQQLLKESIQLSLNAYQQSYKVSETQEQIIPIMVSLKINDISGLSAPRQPMDLICVIDRSGSMEGEKLQLAKQTLNTILGLMSDQDRLQIIQFDDQANLVTGLFTTKSQNKLVFREAIDQILVGGETDITQAMTLALTQLKNRNQRNPVSSIFLLSDGLDYEAYEGVKSALKYINIDDNFTINTFGFGYDHDPLLMQEISSLKDGNFYFIQQLDTLDECFADAIGGLLSVACKDISISVASTNKQLKIIRSYGIKSNNMNDIYQKKLQYMMYGTSKDYVFEVLVPKGLNYLDDQQRSQQLVTAKVQFTEVGSGMVSHLHSALNVDLYLSNEDMPSQHINQDVEYNYLRVKSAQYMKEARILCTQARYQEAQVRLESLISRIKQVNQTPRTEILIQDLQTQLSSCKPQQFESYGLSTMVQAENQQLNQLSQPHLSSSKNKHKSSPYQNSSQLRCQRLIQSQKY